MNGICVRYFYPLLFVFLLSKEVDGRVEDRPALLKSDDNSDQMGAVHKEVRTAIISTVQIKKKKNSPRENISLFLLYL